MITLIRKNSDEPNIQNYEDSRMFRYAFGHKTGIVKDYGNEVIVVQKNNTVANVGIGEIVHQGWQVEISGSGVDVSVPVSGTKTYFTVYLEISLAVSSNQYASILVQSSQNSYPIIDAGDDLTSVVDGTSRVEIAHILNTAGGTMTIERLINVIDYQEDINNDIYNRLDDLGFRQGSFYDFAGTAQTNYIKKTGLNAVGYIDISMSITIPKNTSRTYTIKVPTGFKANESTQFIAAVSYITQYVASTVPIYATLQDYTITMTIQAPAATDATVINIKLLDIGWELERGQVITTVDAPVFSSEWSEEQGGENYYNIIVSNPNGFAVTLRYQIAGSSQWTESTLGPFGSTIITEVAESDRVEFNALFYYRGLTSSITHYSFS